MTQQLVDYPEYDFIRWAVSWVSNFNSVSSTITLPFVNSLTNNF